MNVSPVSGRAVLLGGAAMLGAPLIPGQFAQAAGPGTDLSWGRIANTTHRGDRIYTGLLLAAREDDRLAVTLVSGIVVGGRRLGRAVFGWSGNEVSRWSA